MFGESCIDQILPVIPCAYRWIVSRFLSHFGVEFFCAVSELNGRIPSQVGEVGAVTQSDGGYGKTQASQEIQTQRPC